MNAVGKIGELIVSYQYPIEITLLSILAVIVLFVLIRAIAKNKKEKDVLDEINSKVSDINDVVNTISDRQTAQAAENSTAGNVSVIGEKPSVKVSYTVKDDKKDCVTTVQIDHEVANDDVESFETAAAEELKTDDLEGSEESADELNQVENGSFEALMRQITEKRSEDTGDDHDAEGKEVVQAKSRKVFESRNCATDKYGKVYTEEELSEQIK